MITAEKDIRRDGDIIYEECRVWEGRISIGQLYLHNPDGSMIEMKNLDLLDINNIRNCELLSAHDSNINDS